MTINCYKGNCRWHSKTEPNCDLDKCADFAYKPIVTNDYTCPKCKSRNVNNKSFDHYNFCNDCGYDWKAT